MVIIYFAIFAFIFFLSSLKQINQYERGVKFTMGKYTGIMEPGWRFIWPIFQSFKKLISVLKRFMFLVQKQLRLVNFLWLVKPVIIYPLRILFKQRL